MTPEQIENTIATIKKDFEERGFVPEHNSGFVADLVVMYENLAEELAGIKLNLNSAKSSAVTPAPK